MMAPVEPAPAGAISRLLIEIDALHSNAAPPGNVTRMVSQERQILTARCCHLQYTAAIVITACRVIASSAVVTGRPHRVAECSCCRNGMEAGCRLLVSEDADFAHGLISGCTGAGESRGNWIWVRRGLGHGHRKCRARVILYGGDPT